MTTNDTHKLRDLDMTARQIMARALAHASGRPEDLFLDILARFPHQTPELDREYSPEESGRLLAQFREEAPGILNWLVEGIRRSGARR
jgi:hypothetical protein